MANLRGKSNRQKAPNLAQKLLSNETKTGLANRLGQDNFQL